MTPELTALALAGLLQAIQFVLMAVPANIALGPERTLGPRDGKSLAEDLPVMAGRLNRALSNHFEALILFTIGVVVVTLSQQASGFTATCAWVYLAARIAYVPAYAFGLMPWRSCIWLAGFLATVAMIIAALI
ncbi:MAPEG family protein [Amaricoccus tamworthensis]|uniref:MAPEG family protein n=1 Tax=Amaricoccus tamworthensis TaxID=57002 RepID=UPI003C7AE441